MTSIPGQGVGRVETPERAEKNAPSIEATETESAPFQQILTRADELAQPVALVQTDEQLVLERFELPASGEADTADVGDADELPDAELLTAEFSAVDPDEADAVQAARRVNPVGAASTRPASRDDTHEVDQVASPEKRPRTTDSVARTSKVNQTQAPATETAALDTTNAEHKMGATEKNSDADQGGPVMRRSEAAPPVSGSSISTTRSATLEATSSHDKTLRTDLGTRRPVSQARLIQRVARAFEAVGDGGEIRLRLSPPELGSLRLEVHVENGTLTARVEAETSAARAVLMDNLSTLRDRLADRGIRLESFQVDVPDRQSTGTPDKHQNQRRHHSEEVESNLILDDVLEELDESLVLSSGINITV